MRIGRGNKPGRGKKWGLLVADESDSGYNYGYRDKYPSTIWVAKHECGNQIEPWEQVNYVLSPDDAFPIILENKISMSPCKTRSHKGLWISSDGYVVPECTHKDKNPLRAAMICYLKLNQKI